MKAPLVAAISLCALLIGGGASFADDATDGLAGGAARVGDAAPSFSARDVVSGRDVGSGGFAGKLLVVNFWATWCPPCRAETGEMARAYRQLRAPDVAFLGVDTTEVAPVVTTFMSAKGVPYPVALAGPNVYDAFGISYIPTTIVVDRTGVVRARWTGQLAAQRLGEFVAAARAEKNFVLDTPEQTLLERLLDPAAYDFSGDGAQAAIGRARDNVTAADAFANAHSSGTGATVDYARLLTLEGGLLASAAQRSLQIAKTPAEHVAADRLLAQADNKLGRNAAGIAALADARNAAPDDASLLLDMAKLDYRLHDYPAGISVGLKYTAAMPNDADGWDWLALSYQRARNFAAAAPAYERTLALKEAAFAATRMPKDREDAAADVADSALDAADVYVALGDVVGTTRSFALANAFARHLRSDGPYAELARNVRERTQEGAIAVRMTRGGGKFALSLAAWTGPDLPGSLASTLKYRLILASAPSAKVDLVATGLRSGWGASFCADGLCSPNRVSVTLPDSGVKTYEFQLVPPGALRSPGPVAIRASDGGSVALPR